jgi:hypothetical protein
MRSRAAGADPPRLKKVDAGEAVTPAARQQGLDRETVVVGHEVRVNPDDGEIGTGQSGATSPRSRTRSELAGFRLPKNVTQQRLQPRDVCSTALAEFRPVADESACHFGFVAGQLRA